MRIIRIADIAWLFIAFVGACQVGCFGSPNSPMPSTEEVLSSLGARTSAELGSEEISPKLNLYLDSSGSMAGFVGQSSSQFQLMLDEILDRSVSGGYALDIFKFDSKVTQLPASTATTSLRERNFFSSGETSFPALFEAIGKRKPGTIALVISDLVQSSKTGEQRELSRAFRELASDRPEVVLFALRSSFVGQYWPEATVTRDQFHLDLQGRDIRSTRPFYLLVLADHVEQINTLRRRLGFNFDHGTTSWELDASRPAVLVETAGFAPQLVNAVTGVEWQTAKASVVLPARKRTFRQVTWLVERVSPSIDSSAIPIRYEIGGRIGVDDLSRVKIEAKRCTFTVEGACLEPEGVSVSAELQLHSETDLVIDYHLPRPALGTWDVYQIQLSPGEANLSAPTYASLWATNNDARRDHGSRTYKLDLFVDTLTTSLREPVPFVEQYIVLGRGN